MVSRLVKINGAAVDLLGSQQGQPPGDSRTLINGNFQGYSKAPYSAWTGMWGTFMPNTESLVATSSMRVDPATFPTNTTLSWDVTPDPDWAGVNGFLQVAYGNYDDNPHQVPGGPKQVKNITTLAATIGWTFTGDNRSGLLSECWLTPAATPSGGVAKTCEVAFFPKTSPSSQSWVSGLPNVGTGSFTDSNGVLWNVKRSDTYYIAYRPGFADFTGVLPYKDYFAFLTAAGIITGNEWFNGLAFGVEPHHGAGSLTIDQFSVAYAGA